MKYNRMQPDLLDYLAELAGCDVLSDLRSARFRTAVQRSVMQIPPEQFSAAQWREALYYLLLPTL